MVGPCGQWEVGAMALIVPAMKAGMHEHSDLQVPFDSQPEASGCPTSLTRRFPCHPSSVGAARRAVDELGAWLGPTLLADLRLLVSELMANSVEHGPQRDGRTIWLEVSISTARVRAEVQDGGRGFTPVASRPPVDAPSGRGLFLVDQLAACWGMTSEDGTSVWFELDCDRLGATDDGLEPQRDVVPGVPAAA